MLKKLKKSPKLSLIYISLLIIFLTSIFALILVSSTDIVHLSSALHTSLLLIVSIFLLCLFSCILNLTKRICIDCTMTNLKILPYKDPDTLDTTVYTT